MSSRVRGSVLAGGLALVVALPPVTLRAQIPEEFTNLQVLPEDIARGELVATMRGFSLGLGVRCSYCHVGEEGQPFSEYDFAADDKPEKRKARFMLEMVEYLNGERLPGLTEVGTRVDPPLRVECVTCHRGLAVPRQIGDQIALTIAAEGVEPGLAEYRALREEYYGSAAYDFSEQPLIDLGERLSEEDESGAALAVFALALEYYPESIQALVGTARVHMAREEIEEARAALLRARELAPDEPFIARLLRQLDGGA